MSMGKEPKDFKKTILFLADSLKEKNYAIRGTASMILQGLDMNVSDIDILCDAETALSCNEVFGKYVIDEVSFKESNKFKSYFGKFKINNILVEVMGEWQIKKRDGSWSEPFNGDQKVKINIEGQEVYITTLESELAVFSVMGRWTAYWKIKRQFKEVG